MTNVETYEHSGVQVRIEYDHDCPSPRDADNLCEMHVCYRGYELGDEQLPEDGLPEIDCPNCEGAGYTGTEEKDCERCEGMGRITPTIQEWLADKQAIAAMPLFVYEHSGITIRGGKFVWLADESIERDDTRSTNRFPGDAQGWDTSFVGVMLVTEERVRELCGDEPKYRTREFLADAFDAELDEYDKFVRGETYGYIAGEGTPFQDSCWGFIGFSYVQEEANRAAEAVAEQIKAEANERAEWAARDVVTCGH